MRFISWLMEDRAVTYGFRGIVQTVTMKRWQAILMNPTTWLAFALAVLVLTSL